MKTRLALALLLLVPICASPQGYVYLDNISNTSTNPNAISNGLFWLAPWDWCIPGPPTLINQDFNVAFFAGSDSRSLSLLRSFVFPATYGDNAAGPGTFTNPTGQPVMVPGATTTAFFQIQAWGRYYSSYWDALNRGGPVGSTGVFRNPVAIPPNVPPDLTGMPAVLMWYTCPPYRVRISMLFDPTAQAITLSWPTYNGYYEVQSSTDLKTWTVLTQTWGRVFGGSVSVTFSVGGQAHSFYRVTPTP